MSDQLTSLGLRFNMRPAHGSIPAIPGVYLLRNLRDGKVYVGSASKSLRQRQRQHLSDLTRNKHSNIHLQRAWRRDGEDAFVFEILHVCEPGDCIRLEQQALGDFRSAEMAYGYNLSPTAGSVLGYKMTKQGRANVVAAHARPEVKARRAEVRADPEFKARHAAAMREAMERPDYKAKMSRSVKAAYADRPEIKKKISVALKSAYAERPEFREKVRAASTGRKHTEEAKAKISAAHQRPEIKMRTRAANAGRKRSPETRAKMSAARKRMTEETRAKMAAGAKTGWIKRKAKLATESLVVEPTTE